MVKKLDSIPNELSNAKIETSFFIIEATDDLTIDGMFEGYISSIPTIILNIDCNMVILILDFLRFYTKIKEQLEVSNVSHYCNIQSF